MPVSGKVGDVLGLSIKCAIARGVGLTLQQTADVTQTSMSSVQRYLRDDICPEIEAFTRGAAAMNHTIAVEGVQKSATDRMEWVFDNSFKLTERLIKRALDKGDEATAEELMEIHKNITVWAAKYRMSEAPRRLQIDATHAHEHKHVVTLSEAKNILETRELIAQNSPLLEAVVDASGTPS